jgi:hypothetical protein
MTASLNDNDLADLIDETLALAGDGIAARRP